MPSNKRLLTIIKTNRISVCYTFFSAILWFNAPFTISLVEGVSYFNLLTMAYHYTLDTRKIEVCNADYGGNYTVMWEGQEVGYIYVSEFNIGTGKPVWNGSTPHLNLVAPEIGLYIEEVGM